MLNQFPDGKQQFTIAGPTGQLELATTQPKQPSLQSIIICHPHPLHGGAMANKVVTTLVRTFNELNFNTVRFNFRGVGNSEGVHDHGIGETEDLSSVYHWLQSVLPDTDIWLAGFSFGAYVAYRFAGEMSSAQIKQLILVAPPVQYPEFVTLSEPKMPWLVLQGEQDEVVEPGAVYQWLAEKQTQPELIRFSETSHFFHGKLVELKQQLLDSFA